MNPDAKVIGLVGSAHGLSHFLQLAVPPLFPMIRADLGISYSALGVVIMVFFAASALLQPVAGFLVDRVGATEGAPRRRGADGPRNADRRLRLQHAGARGSACS